MKKDLNSSYNLNLMIQSITKIRLYVNELSDW